MQKADVRRLPVLATLIVMASWLAVAADAGAEPPLGTGRPGELPEQELSRIYLRVEARDLSPAEAERVMSLAIAAVYLPDEGVVRALADREASAAMAAALSPGIAVRGLATTETRAAVAGSATLRDFLSEVGEVMSGAAASDGARYLAKAPARARLDVAPAAPAVGAAGAAADGVVVAEGFEGDPWIRWQRYPGSPSYDWTASTCEAHAGTHSGDPVRGGTAGSQLACDAAHPPAINNWIVDSQCETLTGASQAWLDAYIHTATDNAPNGSAADYLSFFYGPDANGYWWGWSYWGSYDVWSHIVINLRQWYYLGDLTLASCPQLAVVFNSDGSGQEGFGARVDDITVRTGAAPFLSCAIVADPVSGQAPLTVDFAALVTGASGSPAFSWSFGDFDGSTATTQQTSFTYVDAGDFDPGLVVIAGGERCYASVYIAVSEPCTLACSATVPTAGDAGAPIAFQSSATPSHCGGAVSYAWSFGDSTSATEQNPSHTYAAAGTYTWQMTASADGATCTKGGTIAISGNSQSFTYTISSQAHLPGAGGTQWRSNVAAVNLTSSTANLKLTYYPYGAVSVPVVRNTTVNAGATVEWPDILVGLFGQSGSPKGSVEVISDQPLYAIARTFNQAANGTYGQYYPAVTAGQALAAGEVGVLPMLKKNAAFRTNVGILNLGAASVTAVVTLFNSAGTQAGSSKSLTAAPGRYIQQDDIFANVGAGTQDIAYATVEVQTAGGAIWAYASVVDAVTGDPTTVPVLIGATAGPYTISSQAHLPGAGGTQWRSNVAAVNRGGVAANLTMTYFPYSSGAAPVVRNAVVNAGATIEWPDILVGLFGQSGSPKGSVQVASDQPLYLIARTFNQAASGTYGQYYPAVTASQALSPGTVGVLPMLKKNAAFRTNVGILNLGAASVTAVVKLFNAAGAQVGSSKSLTAAASRYIQQDDIFANVGAGTQDIAYATVEVQTAGGAIWAYASVVDAVTGDPTTVPVVVH